MSHDITNLYLEETCFMVGSDSWITFYLKLYGPTSLLPSFHRQFQNVHIILLELLSQTFSNHCASITAVENLRQIMAWYRKVFFLTNFNLKRKCINIPTSWYFNFPLMCAHTFYIIPVCVQNHCIWVQRRWKHFSFALCLCVHYTCTKVNSSFHLHDFFGLFCRHRTCNTTWVESTCRQKSCITYAPNRLNPNNLHLLSFYLPE